jgi:hypothetical protein
MVDHAAPQAASRIATSVEVAGSSVNERADRSSSWAKAEISAPVARCEELISASILEFETVTVSAASD